MFTISNPTITLQVKSETIDVGPTESYTTIQEAINNANPGDTVSVYNGLYYENIVINKTISLLGENRDSTHIISNNNTTITVKSDNIDINGFTIQSTTLDSSSCIDIGDEWKHINIINCNILQGNYGIFIHGEPIGSEHYVNNVTIKECNISNTITGVWLQQSQDILIYHNNLYDNTNNGRNSGSSENWNAPYPTSGNYWDDYTDSDNYHGADQNLPFSDGIGDTPYGIFDGGTDQYPLMNPWDGTSPIPSDQIYVDDDFNDLTYGWGTTHFDKIQHAVENSTNNYTIYVFNGEYYENIIVDKSVKILGETLGNTIIDGGGISDCVQITTNSVELSDFTIINAGGRWPSAGVKISSDLCTIHDINIYDCDDDGIHLDSAKDNTIENIYVDCSDAICLWNSSNDNLFFENYLKNYTGSSGSDYGISLGLNCENNKFYFNDIKDFDLGIYIEKNSNNNIVYQNNFIDNSQNARDLCNNSWYNENSLLGNYWSDYDEADEGAVDNNYDGKADTPYDIPGGDNQDLYPLISYFENQPPVAQTNGPYYGVPGENIQFDGSSSYDPDGLIVNFTWNFDDGNSSYGSTASHTYSQTGTYTVELIVKDNLGRKTLTTTTATITQEEEEPEEPEPDQNLTVNHAPVADANGPYYEFVGVPIQFDGSYSYDEDEDSTLLFTWNFGDGNTSNQIKPTHTYTETGNHTVTLVLEDEHRATDKDITFALISDIPNNPPDTPIINGTQTGRINTSYNFTINGSDVDNDTIKYVINWDDGTNETNSSFVNSSTPFNTSHIWEEAGIYTITIWIVDEHNATSLTVSHEISINALYCSNLGYLLDKDNNGLYDAFYCVPTKEETPALIEGEKYYIDLDQDGTWDWTYNTTSGAFLSYIIEPTSTDEEFDINQIIFIILIFSIAIIIIAALAAIASYTKKSPRKKIKQKQEKMEIQEIIPLTEKEEKLEDIEKKIDNQMKNKKSNKIKTKK